MDAVLWQDGWLSSVRHRPSPNYSLRSSPDISLVVIHHISLPPYRYGGGYVEDFFLNRLDIQAHEFFTQIADMRVSSHFFIQRQGEITQFVSCQNAAHHAGVSEFQGRQKCNDFSIGIELEGCDYEPFSYMQYQSLTSLLDDILSAYPIHAICGHCDIAPVRKTDPGVYFDWQRLQRAGFPVNRQAVMTCETGARTSLSGHA